MSQPSRARSNAEAAASRRRAGGKSGGPYVPGTCPRARRMSGRESQHRDAGDGSRAAIPFMTVPLTAVTGGGVPPYQGDQGVIPARAGGMLSRVASSLAVMGWPVCWWAKAAIRALMSSCPDGTASRS